MNASISSLRLPVRLAFLTVLALDSVCLSASGPVVFTHGVASGDIRPHRAIVWTRLDQAAPVTAEVSADPNFLVKVRSGHGRATALHDFTVKIEIEDLDPAMLYYFRFHAGGSVSETGTFKTPPRPEESANVRFAWSSDFDGSPVPPINQFETLDRAREDGIDFFVYNGDNIYADNPPACGSDIDCMRSKYKQNRGYSALHDLFAATGSYAIWDDHEVVDNFAGTTVDPALLAAGRQAFEEYLPIRDHRREVGFYRTFRWGKEVELFILDERSFRSAEADVACLGDLLPTAPPDVRVLVGLPADPPEGCLAAVGDPARTMLGHEQKERFREALRESDATWKIVINEVAIAELFGVPYDRWEGYAAERTEILNFLRDSGVQNVVFLTGDLHANIIIDVRQGVFTDPTPRAKEFIVGPVAEHTLFEELVGLLGSVDAANGFIGLVNSLTTPDCFEANAYAYGLVEVDSETKQLTITLKDGNGAAICSFTRQAQS
jgi:alkaline phosphatase D